MGSQSATVFGVSYFSSMTNAVNNTSVLSNSQSLPFGTTTFYAKIYNLANSTCNALSSFAVTLAQQPIANLTTDYLICENLPYNSIEQFDLSTKNNSILGNQIASDNTIFYHSTLVDATNDVASLPFLYTNMLPVETLYARIENSLSPTCFAITSFSIKVIQQPQTIMVSNYKICDDAANDGTASFDLTTKTNEILNIQSPSSFYVKYYTNLIDAQNDISAITTPSTFTSGNQTVCYTLFNVGNSNCKSTGAFNLIVSKLPKANTVNSYFKCDDVTNNGVEIFNLQNTTAAVLGTQIASDFNISYHLNQNDADNNSNALPFNYQNTTNPQTIFVRIENNQNTSCYATTSFQIGLYAMPIANQPQDLVLCDNDSNDGNEVFDLSQQNSTVFGTQSVSDFNLSFHLSSMDALNGLNPLSSNYTNTINPQTIYVRMENKLSASCFDTTSFQLIVRPKPVLTLDEAYSICEGNEITVTAPFGFSSYDWSNGGTSYSTVIALAGNYTLTVTKDYGDIICDTSKNFTVVNSNIATINQIIISDWTDTENAITITVTGDGIYEYSIDGYNYQDTSTFEGLRYGEYTVYVRDKNGCGIANQEVFLLMYPKFFTPNGDGINDNWQIKFSAFEPNMEILLFDRYGKLINNFKGVNFGWDGTYNGKLLPSDDYWFVVKRKNGKEFKGHFAMKR